MLFHKSSKPRDDEAHLTEQGIEAKSEIERLRSSGTRSDKTHDTQPSTPSVKTYDHQLMSNPAALSYRTLPFFNLVDQSLILDDDKLLSAAAAI